MKPAAPKQKAPKYRQLHWSSLSSKAVEGTVWEKTAGGADKAEEEGSEQVLKIDADLISAHFQEKEKVKQVEKKSKVGVGSSARTPAILDALLHTLQSDTSSDAEISRFQFDSRG